MWIERMPTEGETVKVEFASWTQLGTKIGVFLRYHCGRAIIDFGDKLRWLEAGSSFLVYER
jgi:hypothetical protein